VSKIILHRLDTDYRNGLNLTYGRDSQLVERRDIISYDSDRHVLTVHHSRYLTGVNKQGSRYWKWVTDGSTSVGINKRSQFYTRTMWGGEFKRTRTFISDGADTWRALSNSEFYRLTGNQPFHYFARHIFDSDFSIGEVYPITKNWEEIQGFNQVPFGMPELKESDPRVFIERLFGKKNYRKDLAKAVLEVDPRNLWMVNLCTTFKPYVPIDWIIRFLRENGKQRFRGHEAIDNRFNGRAFRHLLPKFDRPSYRHLMFHVMEDREYRELGDVMQRGLRFGAQDLGNFGTVRSFHDIHEAIWAPRNPRINNNQVIPAVIDRPALRNRYGFYTQEVDKTKEIPLLPQAEKLAESPMVVLPKTVQDLYDWSDEFGNCISSYHTDVTKKVGSTILGKIVWEGKSIACFEIRKDEASFAVQNIDPLTADYRWTLKQLLGKYNQHLPQDIRSMIEHMMREKDITVPDNYWGSAEHYDVLAEF
jgi:hypothetical protein